MKSLFGEWWSRSVVVVVFGITLTASAQWASQPITLRPGWNAVYLEVQPEPAECETLFAGLRVESAWRFSRRQTAIQFIDNPSQLVANAPNWLTWFPPGSALFSQNKLFTLEGGRPYLIKLADDAVPMEWVVRGTPVVRKPDWLADSLNFVGFSLPTSATPTFQAFFTNSPALATGRIYRLNASGLWIQLNQPNSTPMVRGEAFWIRSTGLPDYAGPLEVQLDRRIGLDFGQSLTEETLHIRNSSTTLPRTVTIRQLASTSPPGPNFPPLAGSVPMSYWLNDFAGRKLGWADLPSELTQTIPPGGAWDLRLEVRRRDMTRFASTTGSAKPLFQSLLEVTDSASTTRMLIPVKSEGPQGGGRAGAALADVTSPDPRAGLWVGNVSIKKVSQPSSANPSEPVQTGADFSFRILVHLDSGGQAKLLQRVLEMWRPGETNAAGSITAPGRYVLLTDEAKISAAFTGTALRDGKAVGRRLSSAAFSFREPVLFAGDGPFGSAGTVLSCSVHLDYADPLNPFVHSYHPDHDNRDDRGASLKVKVSASGQHSTSESPSVDRLIRLQFGASDPDGFALSGWGDTQVGGVYEETVQGLHATPLVCTGTFRMHRASHVPVLNDGR
ncbi:MAG: hypothetical protein JNN07_07800 [Verrucomicrobiales bacterium]|nr:hypothetical protein [Verrucomicrobiales bacterium]